MSFILYFTLICPTSTFEGHMKLNTLQEAMDEFSHVLTTPYEDLSMANPNQCKKVNPRLESAK